MCSDSPTRGFPYTNSWLPLTWSGPGLSALIHPAAPDHVCVSTCVWVSVWELTSAVMTAHWKGTCGEPEPARSLQDACNQALRTVSLLCPLRLRTDAHRWDSNHAMVKTRECVASLKGIQNEHVPTLFPHALCRTPTSVLVTFSLIVTESCWTECSKLQILTVVNIGPI